MTVSFKQFREEKLLTEALERDNMLERVVQQRASGVWSAPQTAEELMRELGLLDDGIV